MTMLRAGDTFKAADLQRENHLWVILSDPESCPEDPVLIANLTTWREDKDPACILRPGDHPFVRRKTCVNYADSEVPEPELLERALAQGALVPHRTPKPDVLRRIREGAAASEMTPLEHVQLLRDQGLID